MPSSHVITSVTFEKLLARLAPDRERAGEEYETLRRRLIKYFDLKGLRSPDSAADETLDRVASKIQAGEDIRDLIHYAYGVARWISLERFRVEERERKAYDNLVHPLGSGGVQSAASYLETLEICLEELAEPDRELLRVYYTDATSADCAQNRIDLAQRKGLSLNSIRLRVFRLRQTLARCVRGQL